MDGDQGESQIPNPSLSSAPAPADDEVRLAAEPAGSTSIAGDLPAARFAVGDHVMGPAVGVDRAVYGHRRTLVGEELQFGPGAPWLPAEGFEVRPT